MVSASNWFKGPRTRSTRSSRDRRGRRRGSGAGHGVRASRPAARRLPRCPEHPHRPRTRDRAALAEIPRASAETPTPRSRGPRRRCPPGAPSPPPTARGSSHRSPTRWRTKNEELATLEARNAGKPIGDARGEIGMVADTFRYYAGAVERNLGDTIPVSGGIGHDLPRAARRRRTDHAVELPADDRGWKLAPALAAGNTVVLKPAELTPLSSDRVREDSPSTPGCPRAWSTSSPGRARPSARRWSSTPTWPRSRSPARPRSAARSPPAPRRRSSASRSSSAASPRTSSSPTPTSRPPPRRRRWPSSATPARTAARARGSSCSARRSTLHGRARGGRRGGRRSATRSTRRPTWAR